MNEAEAGAGHIDPVLKAAGLTFNYTCGKCEGCGLDGVGCAGSVRA